MLIAQPVCLPFCEPSQRFFSFLVPSAEQVDMSSDGCLEVAWKGQAFPYLMHHPADPASEYTNRVQRIMTACYPMTEPSDSMHLQKQFVSCRQRYRVGVIRNSQRGSESSPGRATEGAFARTARTIQRVSSPSNVMPYCLRVRTLVNRACARRWQQECGMDGHHTASWPPTSRAKPSHQQPNRARSLGMLLWAS